MKKLELTNADVRILIASMIFVALLVVLLLPGNLDASLFCPAWLPFPIPYP
jgi:hypothetical protein